MTPNEIIHSAPRPATTPAASVKALSRLRDERNAVYCTLMGTDRPATELRDSWDVRELESGEAMREVERRRREDLFARLRRIDEALARADAGTYGLCLECDEPIPPKRLELDPAVRLCIACQTKREGDQAHPSL